MSQNCFHQADYNRKDTIFSQIRLKLARKIQIYRFCVFRAFLYGKGDNIFLKWVIQKEKDTKYMVLDLWSENTAKMSRR